MRLIAFGVLFTSLVASCVAKSASFATNESVSSTQQVIQADFKPPQVFENTNLVRTTNLEKGYVRETINVVVTNKDAKPQSEYYVPFEYDVIGKVGGFEVRDKKDAEKGRFQITTTAFTGVAGHDGSSVK